ncbi:MAG: type II toxin-antitoxin system VapC family toxin [Deltaproteobacteria bacterium]|nr:type II toxin-antitoxin system VapC family toxin [Deltaproteobacteria bacterium]
MNQIYLLDTHALLWWINDDKNLSRRAKAIILEIQNIILVSTATLWEIAIKQRKGKLIGCEEYLNRYPALHKTWGFNSLDIRPEHAVRAGLLPTEHGDPFDRMLIAQSQLANATLITCDPEIRELHPNCLW